MLKPVCDICKGKADGPGVEHYCDRCLPFAEEFREKRLVVQAEILQYANRRLEQFCNEFLRTTVVPSTRKMEAVK